MYSKTGSFQVPKQTHPKRLINISEPQTGFKCYTYTAYDVTQVIFIHFEYVNRKRSGRNIKILSKLILRLKQFHYQKRQLSQTVVWPKNTKEHHCFQDLWFPLIRDPFCSYLDLAQGDFLTAWYISIKRSISLQLSKHRDVLGHTLTSLNPL